jgi:hypothetical protein
MPSLLKLAGFAALAAVSFYFFIVLCGFYFQCGCESWHAAAATHCNIHRAGVKHCPMCVIPYWQHLSLIALIVAAQGCLVWRGRWLSAAIAFPVLAGAEALVLGWYRGYWS